MIEFETGAARPTASRRSQRSLDWFAFFVANLQAGFGPFVAVYLTSESWTQTDIGLLLTIGGVASLVLQLPGGAMVDATTAKKAIAAWSVALVGLSALMLVMSTTFLVILLGWVLHAAASATLTPALAATSLGLVGHDGVARRFGRNASFASAGNAIAAAVMGGIGYWVSNQAVFVVTAALAVPALFALRGIASHEIDPHVSRGEDSEASGWEALWPLVTSKPLYTLFICMTLYFVGNAALLPLIGSALTLRSEDSPTLFIAACIIAPQVLVTVLSPVVGAKAQSWGRKPLLLLAFSVLPIRAFGFAFIHDEYWLVLIQTLDGVSAAIIGVLVSVIVADATRKTGHFALGQSIVGIGMGLGSAISTLLGGFLADRLGSANAFIGLGSVAILAFLVVLVAMPETRPRLERRKAGQ
ncbi:MFS transporter [Enterovirga rhinocerotis]|uniref:Putative MFS family arabinose efflux permease n=1 Tax=Enterovirga rhinocerotis TaxID=1339210 RepID=A0A4V6PZJ6_9HYPH|nr:MFS transporter [Enterovirga rhinocerotis]TDR90459.1 putative MFS family arabinose efflux permease [Enterovirga rhinocerotis]